MALSIEKIAGFNLRRLIKDNGMTQEDFAFEMNMDLRTLSRYINEGIKKMVLLQEFSEFFDVEYMEFFKEINF